MIRPPRYEAIGIDATSQIAAPQLSRKPVREGPSVRSTGTIYVGDAEQSSMVMNPRDGTASGCSNAAQGHTVVVLVSSNGNAA